ncbi:hypothetical protein [Oerskovia gallyi]|uniref:Uncharacterized protein n=1 Tax=Oerskovia gallyi TaxID=2762226 RepID=A0ABR8V0F7_9CELL|nr:hypothetical protein [Oerskovia gallyi]MBD7998175.1 hypothetical protein [Oerskovia gallyi]
MSYAHDRLAAALVTAAAHHDAETRTRAATRVRDWSRHLRAVARGDVEVGSRAPAKEFPAWVTLDVLHGGFATGEPSAGGALSSEERQTARRWGVSETRQALLAGALTERGLADLDEMLRSGRFTVVHPENAALLVVAWLVRAGDIDGAARLVAEIAPYGDRLRFLPAGRPVSVTPGGVVHRYTAGDVHERLVRRRPHRQVEAQREALDVWNPFADRLLALWVETVEDGVVDAVRPAGWRDRVRAAAQEHATLSAEHTLCTAHGNPKKNLGALVRATRSVAAGAPLVARDRGRLQAAVDGMTRKRGAPGSSLLQAIREAQAHAGEAPSHAAVAGIVAGRVARRPAWSGIEDVDALVTQVAADEETRHVPAGTVVPRQIARVVRLARSAPLDDLLCEGDVPSAEVLAQLVPQVAGAVVSRGLDDDLSRVIAESYRAFRARRSVLLRNLAAQVRFAELPWVAAVDGHRASGSVGAPEGLAVARELAGSCLRRFPERIVPNTLVVELEALLADAGIDSPLVPELAADIFEGAFSRRFIEAASRTSEIAGALYQDYFGIREDLAEVVRAAGGPRARTWFADLCRRRAAAIGASDADLRFVVNGMVIEQAQILTTHNLAALVSVGAVAPDDFGPLARAAFAEARRGVVGGRTQWSRGDRHAAANTIKNAAYAWRQSVFFLAGARPDEQHELVHWFGAVTSAHSDEQAAALGPVVADLARVLAGGPRPSLPFVGWAAGPHPMLVDVVPAPGRRIDER